MPAGPRYTRWRGDLSRSAGERSRAWSSAEERKERARYTALKADLTRAPDGSYPAVIQDSDEDGQASSGGPTGRAPVPPLEVNNPLSLSDRNPWHSYFASLAMLDQINVDVQRAFPDDERLRPERVQRQLVRVLFVWSLMGENVQVGYRQGMHEIAAICWLVYSEAADRAAGETHAEADTFVLFELVMARARPWFEWRDQKKFPISQRCDAIQALLSATDASLAAHLDRLGVETQLYAIRWVRLLFTRELPLPMALLLWDALFSLDPSLELVDGVCVAMLIRIRTQLLDSDYSLAFQALLNYPSYALQCPPETLVKQAEAICRSPGQMTLMSLMEENESVLDMPGPRNNSYDPAGAAAAAASSPQHAVQPPSLSQLTRGVYAQSLSAGLNRALYNVQRTVNAAYLSQTAANGASDGFPPSIESLHRPGNVARDAGGELDELRQTNRLIGGSLIRVIEVLEKYWSHEVVGKRSGLEPKTSQTPQEPKQPQESQEPTQAEMDFLLSLTTLKHSRDVLLGITPDFDSSIIEGPRAVKEEDRKAREFGQRFARSVDPAPLPSNQPVASRHGEEQPPATTAYPPSGRAKGPIEDPLGVAGG